MRILFEPNGIRAVCCVAVCFQNEEFRLFVPLIKPTAFVGYGMLDAQRNQTKCIRAKSHLITIHKTRMGGWEV